MPRSATALPQTCTAVGRQRRIPTEASIPTLRHASATPLVARGVARRVMQARLGHRRLRTPARDTPLTPPTWDVVHATITARRADRESAGGTDMPA
jgi:site-specific recombinase XerD